MRNVRRLTPILLLVALAASCAPNIRASDSEEEPRSSSSRLVKADIMATGERNLFDVIERLRPRWLRVRSVTSVMGAPAPIVVYHNNVRAGGIEVLYGMRIEGIQEARFISATDATTRWGMGHTSGVIEVTSTGQR